MAAGHERAPRSERALALAALALAVVLSAWVRIHFTFADPAFDRSSADGLLRTDPAFLHYVAGRIAGAGGLAPADFRADPRLEHPETTDIPAIETVGQEFLVAWAWLASGQAAPLHVAAVWSMGIWAALAALGVFGMAFELARSWRWAALAALLWAAMLGNYRTLGFVLIREDFALPWLALHGWLVLRAARVRSPAAFVLAGASAAAAAATWHAASFVLLMEAACLFAWFLRSGENPLGARRAWLAPAAAALVSLAFPVLRATHFALSFPLQLAGGLALAGLAARGRGRAVHAGLALGCALALFAAARLAAGLGGGLDDYGHVVDLILAKVRFLGRLPEDPDRLSFGARVLWQGPFQTADPRTLAYNLAAGSAAVLLAAAIGVPGWLRGRGEAVFLVSFAFCVLAVVASALIERVAVILGAASPVLAVALAARVPARALATGILAAAIAGHAVHTGVLLSRWEPTWSKYPPTPAELRQALDWIRTNVPAGEAVAADFLTSSAILAATGRPVIQQPKYETRRSRERIERFFTVLFQQGPRDFVGHVSSLRCRWIVLNLPFLANNTALGGVRPQELFARPDTAAARFLHPDARSALKVGGATLVYRVPSASLRGLDGIRIYRID